MESIENRAIVLLASGHILKIAGVMLYPAGGLARIASIRADAATKLGGVSTGIGFIGCYGDSALNSNAVGSDVVN